MKKEKKIEAETAAELKESIERLAKEENMTPVELMSFVHGTGNGGKSSLFSIPAFVPHHR